MSYGWLTESSLIPKPGKQIENVSASSLTGLRALTIEKHEEVKKHQAKTGSSYHKPTKKFRTRMELRTLESNKDVKIRDAKDLLQHSESVPTYDATKKKLLEKAKLYDALESLQKSSEMLCLDIEKKTKTMNTAFKENIKKNLENRLQQLRSKKKKSKIILDKA